MLLVVQLALVLCLLMMVAAAAVHKAGRVLCLPLLLLPLLY